MKKFYSISLAFLIVIAGMHLTVAIHYCGGSIAASKISFSGELATCGMENSVETCPLHGNHFQSHCCDDEVSVYAIDNNYSPSFPDVISISQNILQAFYLPISEVLPSSSIIDININASPPWELYTSAVRLIDICVFRN